MPPDTPPTTCKGDQGRLLGHAKRATPEERVEGSRASGRQKAEPSGIPLVAGFPRVFGHSSERRVWDLNPRWGCPHDGFQDRKHFFCNQPCNTGNDREVPRKSYTAKR